MNGSVLLLDAQSGKLIATLDGPTHPVRCVAISPDGSQIAAGSGSFSSGEGALYIWQIATHSLVRKLNGHDHAVMSVAFGPNGGQIAKRR